MTEATERPAGAVVPWEGGLQEEIASTLPQADWKKLLAYMGEALSADELKDHPAAIEHVIVHRATVRDEESGEEIPVRRTILIDTQGRSYACVSEGVISSLRQISAAGGPPPWKGGLKLKLVEKQVRGGARRVKRLVPA